MMPAKDQVAIILAISVLSFILLGVTRSFFSGLAPIKVEVLNTWKDIILLISGGLISYFSKEK